MPHIKVQLVTAYAVAQLLFGCVAWGYCFDISFSLQCAGCSTASKMEVLYCAALRWSVGAPTDMHAVALHFITASIPLHELILKHTVRYYGIMEHDKAAYYAMEETLATAATQDDSDQLYFQLQHLRQPWWAAGFMQSAVEVIEK